MRNIIIGDVHGCFDELEALLDRVNLDQEKDRLIFIGDLMDRGSKSYEVFSMVKSLKERMGERCVIIRGNHEEMCLDGQKSRTDEIQWQRNGSLKTIHSFYNRGDDIENHREWIAENTVYYYRDKDFQCVHAGLIRENPEENEIDTLIYGTGILSSSTATTGNLPSLGIPRLTFRSI